VEFGEWEKLVERIKNPSKEATIAIAGKYTAVKDAYISISEALVHSGAKFGARVRVKWVETSEVEKGKKPSEVLEGCDGLIVPGGFGKRGAEGKVECIKWARENKVPYLGLCYGMQLACVEYARDVCGLKDANTTENDEKTPHPVVDFLPEQRKITAKGATMRLGAYDCVLEKGSVACKIYGSEKISERHRHRYEINNDYVKRLEEGGLGFCGKSPAGDIMEMMEWKEGFGIGTQAHPELKSRFLAPAPLFAAFLDACLKRQKK